MRGCRGGTGQQGVCWYDMLACRDKAVVYVVFKDRKKAKKGNQLFSENTRKHPRQQSQAWQWTVYQLLYNTPSPFVVKLCFRAVCLMLDNKLWCNCSLQKHENGFGRAFHSFTEMCSILSLTSAVTVAFGAKPWPGLIDSVCCPVGTLHRRSKAMEAWPGRNSITN